MKTLSLYFHQQHYGADSFLSRRGQRDGKYSHYDGIGHLYFLGREYLWNQDLLERYLLAGCAWWLKVPVPMMPFIEFFGIFTKPFALMIRLFANMLAGAHGDAGAYLPDLYLGKHGACTERHADGGFCIVQHLL